MSQKLLHARIVKPTIDYLHVLHFHSCRTSRLCRAVLFQAIYRPTAGAGSSRWFGLGYEAHLRLSFL